MPQRNSFYTLIEKLRENVAVAAAMNVENGFVEKAVEVAEAEADDRLLNHMALCYSGRSPLAMAATLAFILREDYLEPPSAKASDTDRLKLAKYHSECDFNGAAFWNAPTYESAVGALFMIAVDVADAYQNLQLAFASKHGPIARKNGRTDEQADAAMLNDLQHYQD